MKKEAAYLLVILLAVASSRNISTCDGTSEVSLDFGKLPSNNSVLIHWWRKTLSSKQKSLIAQQSKTKFVAFEALNHRLSQQHDGSLKLHPVSTDDAGDYIRGVKLKETTGYIFSNITLIVYEPPSGPPQVQTYVDKNNKNKNYVCKETKSLGYPPVTMQMKVVEFPNGGHQYNCCFFGIAAECLLKGQTCSNLTLQLDTENCEVECFLWFLICWILLSIAIVVIVHLTISKKEEMCKSNLCRELRQRFTGYQGLCFLIFGGIFSFACMVFASVRICLQKKDCGSLHYQIVIGCFTSLLPILITISAFVYKAHTVDKRNNWTGRRLEWQGKNYQCKYNARDNAVVLVSNDIEDNEEGEESVLNQ